MSDIVDRRSQHRSRWIVGVALAGSAVLGVAGVIPSAPARAAGTPIQHVVVLYLENHSFDNVLGAWCDQTGRCLGMPPKVTLKKGTVVTPTTTPDRVPQLGHLVKDQVAAMDGGKMDGWASVGGCKATNHYICISGYQPSQIPNEIKLANAFGINDHTFSMADSPSWGGHLYAVMASTDGFTGDNPIPVPGGSPAPGNGWGCDSYKVTQWIQSGGTTTLVPSCIPDPSLDPVAYPNGGAFEPTPALYAPTIMDRLNTAGLSWKIYGSHNGQNGYNWATCPSIAECLDTPAQYANDVNSEQFVIDAKAGALPAFSLVVPGDLTTSYSQHNGTSMKKGDNWLGQIAAAVQTGPEWLSTALFITYDDFGGFYDSVPPGLNPDGTQEGPRVPLLIVSPYAIAAHTDTTPATFASILAYTEQNFGLTSLSANDAAGAYAFGNAFNYNQTPLQPVAMQLSKLPPGANAPAAIDPSDPT
jgi:phospholipase C